MKFVKACDIKFRREGIYVYSFANTPYGLVGNLPITRLEVNVEPEVLGNVLLELLNAIPETVTHVDFMSLRKLFSEHLRSLGFESGDAFEKKSRSLMIKIATAQKIAVVPNRAASGGGYITLTEQTKYCRLDAEEVGKLVFEQQLNCKR
jgi:hypothetical protein